MNLDNLIRKYEKRLEAYKNDATMSLSESYFGEKWCTVVLKDLRALKENSNG